MLFLLIFHIIHLLLFSERPNVIENKKQVKLSNKVEQVIFHKRSERLVLDMIDNKEAVGSHKMICWMLCFLYERGS